MTPSDSACIGWYEMSRVPLAERPQALAFDNGKFAGSPGTRVPSVADYRWRLVKKLALCGSGRPLAFPKMSHAKSPDYNERFYLDCAQELAKTSSHRNHPAAIGDPENWVARLGSRA